MIDNISRKINLIDGLLCPECGKWAKEKLDYLERYLNAFSNSLKNKFSHRCYLDLFSGAGINKIKNLEELILGSSLISLYIKVPFTDYFFVEKEKDSFKALETRVKSINPNVVLYNEDCKSAITKIINTIEKMSSQAGIAFLDPYGFELEWSIIIHLARLKRMDLLINFTQMGIKRNLELLYQSTSQNKIDLFFGNIEWRDIYARYRNDNYFEKLIEFYLNNLNKLGYKYYDNKPISPLISNKNNAPLYRLIFASKNQLGYEIWNSIAKKKPDGQLSFELKEKQNVKEL